MDITDNDALSAAYATAKPLMDEIAPSLPDTLGHLAGLAMIVQYTLAESDRQSIRETYHGIKRSITVLSQVATRYHELAGKLVASEEGGAASSAEGSEGFHEQLE